MNKGKEPVSQRHNPINLRVVSEESALPNKKKILKLNTKLENYSPKDTPQKESDLFFPKPIPVKTKPSRQTAHRAQSVEKLPPPQTNDIKSKAIVTGKVPSREGAAPRQPSRPEKTQESENKDNRLAKNMSPNKERPVRELTKGRENYPRKDTLEVVSEENEEHFRETLQSLKKKENEKKPESPGKGQLSESNSNLARVELVLDETNLNKGKIVVPKREGEEGLSPKREKKELLIITKPMEGESLKKIDEPGTPIEEAKSANQVRGAFTKEHVLGSVRQKEQDQKKLMREYLDSQLNEKKKLKEEEKQRQIEEDKKEEARLKREMAELNRQYEKEMGSSKVRTESPVKEVRVKPTKREASPELKKQVSKREDSPELRKQLKREDSPELKKLEQDRDSLSELGFGSRKSLKLKPMKDDAAIRREIEEKLGEYYEPGNFKKLAEENEQLRNQNLRKNELIDILITALKNSGQEGTISSDQLRYTPGFPQSRAKSRTVYEKASGVPSRSTADTDNQLLERNNNSPWSTGGANYYSTLRCETDPDANLEEPLSPISTGPQPNTYRASENLSRLINPNIHSEVKLPIIPDFYSHRKGYSALVDQNNSMKGLTFLSRSNLQPLDNNANTSQTSSRMQGTPFTNKISPRQFSLNISSPSNAIILKPKSEIMTTSVTPTIYSRQITHFGRIKGEGSPDVDLMSIGGRSTVDLDSQRMMPSLSQLSVRKGRDSGLPPAFQLPSSPFRAANGINPRTIAPVDTRSPIRVVDMGNGQAGRMKGESVDRETKTMTDEVKDIRAYPFMKEREPRQREEVPAVRDGLKSVRSVDNHLDKGDGERIDPVTSKNKFPKEIFCLNLRKKVGV